MDRTGYLLDLPVMEYGRVHELQLAVVEALYTQRLQNDVVMLVEHSPVFTLGRRGGRDNLLVSPGLLKQRGIEVVQIERGGDITYHGPGQLVVYLMMSLQDLRMGVADFVGLLETAMILTAAHWGVDASGDADNRGAWVGNRKLGSIGITVRRGITFHGLAMNIHTDLEPFEWINPCGLKNCQLTTLEEEVGRTLDMKTAREQMASHLSELFELPLASIKLDELKAQL